MLEVLQARDLDVRIQIFATDIDERAVAVARRGCYRDDIAIDVSPDRLARFFVKKDGGYQVARRVRDLVVFSQHDLLRDAPFSRIDLVSCRNLLIYLKPAAQRRVFNVLHYALSALEPRYVLLGASETIGESTDLFSLVDAKAKIFVKKPRGRARPVPAGTWRGTAPAPNEALPGARPATSLATLADRKVLELHGPPGVVVDSELEIVQFRGHTGPFLEPVPGAASLNLLKLARVELHAALRHLVDEARATHRSAAAEVPFRRDDRRAVRIEVVPFDGPEGGHEFQLVLFQALAEHAPGPPAAASAGDDGGQLRWRIDELAHELATTKEYLLETIEDRDAASQELVSANEELQSANEELQSTVEELETSKEEMQSTNEELTTVNEELQHRIDELAQLNDDLQNVLTGVDQAVLIVGLDLRLRRYTRAAERLFNLQPGDIGRKLDLLDSFFGNGDLTAKVNATMNGLATLEEELAAANRRWYALRIAPYLAVDHTVRGAVLSLQDVDLRRRSAALTRDVGEYASRFLAAIGQPLVIVDARLRVVWANERFYDVFELAVEETVGNLLPEVGAQRWSDPRLPELVHRTLVSRAPQRGVEIFDRFAPAQTRPLRLGSSQVPLASDVELVLISIDDPGPAPHVRA